MILFWTLILLLLIGPGAAYAKGGSTTQVDAVGPKSAELQALEKRFYDMANPLMDAYTAPLSPAGRVSNGKRGQTAPVQAGVAQQAAAAPAGRSFVSGGGGGGAASRLVTAQAPAAPAQAQTPAAAVSNGKGAQGGRGGTPQPYDNNTLMGQLFNDATKKTYAANSRYDELMGAAPALSAGQAEALKGASAAGDPWYASAQDAYGQANELLGGMKGNLEYSNKANRWYDDYTRDALTSSKNLLDTGEVPQPILDALTAAMTSGVDKSVGASLNDLAARGVVNSSVTNRGLADMSKSVADSMNENYLSALSTLVGGYQGNASAGADAGRAFADISLNMNNAYGDAMKSAIGLGDSYGKTGSMRVNDMLGVAGGYGGALSANAAERGALMDDVSKYYINAAAPMMPAYDLLKTMQADHVNSNKKDTIVKQGK